MKKSFSKWAKKYFQFVFLVYLLFPVSCSDLKFRCIDSCCGESFDKQFTAIEDLGLTVGSIVIYQENGYDRIDFIDTLTSGWTQAGIMINVQEIRSVEIASLNSERSFNFSLLNSGYACDPVEPEPTQKIETISISSNQDLNYNNELIASGEDLSAHFYVVDLFADGKDISIEEFITNQNDNPYLLGPYNSFLVIRLNKQLKMPEQRLTVLISFEDNSSFELSTDSFIIE